MNRRVIVVVGIVILLGVALLGYLKQYSGGRKTAPTTVAFPTIAPSQFVRPVRQGPVSYTSAPEASFPATAPRYSVRQSVSFATFHKSLVSAFRLTGSPQIIEGSRGAHAVLTDGIKQLIASDRPLYFSFMEATLSGKRVTGDASYYQQTAQSRIESLRLLSPPLSLSSPTYQFLAPKGTEPVITTANNATVAQINYGVSLDGRAVYVGDAASPVFFARYDGANELIQVNGYSLPAVQKEPGETPLLPYDQALIRLRSGQGVLSSVAPAGPTVEYLNAQDIQNIRVTSVELAYFYTETSADLVPVYIFKGVSSDSLRAGSVQTVTVVSATQ